jgi:hypothetical protein
MMKKKTIASLRERIRAAPVPTEDVTIAIWNLTLHLRAVSAKEVVELSGIVNAEEQGAAMLAMSIVDAEGNRVYDRETIHELLEKDYASVAQLLDAARRVNGLETDTVKKD